MSFFLFRVRQWRFGGEEWLYLVAGSYMYGGRRVWSGGRRKHTFVYSHSETFNLLTRLVGVFKEDGSDFCGGRTTSFESKVGGEEKLIMMLRDLLRRLFRKTTFIEIYSNLHLPGATCVRMCGVVQVRSTRQNLYHLVLVRLLLPLRPGRLLILDVGDEWMVRLLRKGVLREKLSLVFAAP